MPSCLSLDGKGELRREGGRQEIVQCVDTLFIFWFIPITTSSKQGRLSSSSFPMASAEGWNGSVLYCSVLSYPGSGLAFSERPRERRLLTRLLKSKISNTHRLSSSELFLLSASKHILFNRCYLLSVSDYSLSHACMRGATEKVPRRLTPRRQGLGLRRSVIGYGQQ